MRTWREGKGREGEGEGGETTKSERGTLEERNGRKMNEKKSNEQAGIRNVKQRERSKSVAFEKNRVYVFEKEGRKEAYRKREDGKRTRLFVSDVRLRISQRLSSHERPDFLPVEHGWEVKDDLGERRLTVGFVEAGDDDG